MLLSARTAAFTDHLSSWSHSLEVDCGHLKTALDRAPHEGYGRELLRHMEKERVVLFAGGTGNPYFSTDTAAVLRAIEMGSDVVIKATKVQGVYTADPAKNPDAEFIPNITFQEIVSRELAVMDAAAVSLCKENGLPIIVLNLENRGAVADAIRGEHVGTLVS